MLNKAEVINHFLKVYLWVRILNFGCIDDGILGLLLLICGSLSF